MPLTITQVKARYDSLSMGYDDAVMYLIREFGMSEAMADDILHPPVRDTRVVMDDLISDFWRR